MSLNQHIPFTLKTAFAFLIALTYAATTALANVKLPAIITDGMVLQQQSNVTLWGWASPGEKLSISASWMNGRVNTVADAKGEWKAKLKTTVAGGPYAITFKGNNNIVINNVLLGEVWFCSGQSNMKFTMGKGPANWQNGVNNMEEEIAKADYPKIRQFTAKEVISDTLSKDTEGHWMDCTPQNAAQFSAVAYYYAREIFKKTGFPVGLICSYWGGTPAESWTSRKVLLANDDLKQIVTRYEDGLQHFDELTQKYKAAYAQWQQDTAVAKKQHVKLPAKPAAPIGLHSNIAPYKLYNGMIAPIEAYTVKGVIWYQGESNATRAYQYRKLFPAMIKSWREERHDTNLPFYFVQVSPHYTENGVIRESQLIAWQSLPHTGMVVTTDNGDSTNIHPRNKELVGSRLALWALKNEYGFKDVVPSGPLYRSMKVEGSSIRLNFDYTDGDLKAKDGALKEFIIAGDDHVFHTAQARIEGNSVVISSPLVAKPVAVRFAYRAIPQPNFYNGAGLPATPFRTDNWPVETQNIN